MEAFDIEAELSIGNLALYVMPFMHQPHNSSTAFSLVLDGVKVGIICKGEDSIWECFGEAPWHTEDTQIIGYQIDKYYTHSRRINESI